MQEKFIASNRKEGLVKIGSWESVCDLDKRNWNVRPWTTEDEPKLPLATIEVVEKGFECPIDKDIYSHHELVGVYLG